MGVEAIFLNPQGENAMVNLYRQFRTLNWDIPIYGTFMPGGSVFLSAFGKLSDGIIYADVQFNSLMFNQAGKAIYEKFLAEFGPVNGAEHFSALSILAFSVLDKAIKSGVDVRQYLYKSKFSELTDDFSFDKNGDVVSSKITYVLKTIKNGKPSEY